MCGGDEYRFRISIMDDNYQARSSEFEYLDFIERHVQYETSRITHEEILTHERTRDKGSPE
jgi:hypothetical protein